MTKKKSTRSTKEDKTSYKPLSGDYVNINGTLYEKVSSNSVEIEIELEEDVLSAIDGLIDSGKYVSRGDAVRDILRRKLEDSNL